MMVSPSLSILDVGHGNCAVLIDTKAVVVFDACVGDLLLQFLEEHGVSEIHSVLLSHADKDHIAGVQTLLLSEKVKVGHVYVNPDSRATDTWDDFRRALRVARETKETIVNPELTTNLSGKIPCGTVRVEVLHPDPETALGSTAGTDLHGNRLNPHSVSAVIRLVSGRIPVALLPGDLDGDGLLLLKKGGRNAKARLLVFPHHGGHPGKSDPVEFTTSLCRLVRPQLVVSR